jgi:hypothetical protein
MKRIALTLLAAVIGVALVGLVATNGRPAPRAHVSGGTPEDHGADLRPVPPGGPRHEPAAKHASLTPHGLPPESGRAHGRARGEEIVDRNPPPANRNIEEEVENEENSNGYSSKQMLFHGGVVQNSPRVYLVFWGSSWTTNGDPSGVANRLHYTYQGIGGSSWANVLTQFGGSNGSFTNTTGQYRGWLRDLSPVPANPTAADVQRVVQRAADTMRDYAYNAQYVIALPWGVVDQYTQSQNACGYHNWKTVSATSWTTYSVLPYIPYLNRIGVGGTCGTGTVNGASGALDGVSIVAGHEYAESVNDPGLNAWFDADGSENGDKCAWVNGQNRTLANGYSFAMQPVWSNTWKTQYGYGCFFS